MEFNYVGPRMQGAQSTFQQWQITPLSSNQYWQPNDVVKFMGNISQGVIDFYRSHIEYQIQVTTEMMPIGLIQVDTSAQSLINQTILQSNQVEIERIQQYDVLAAALIDIGFSEVVAQGRSGQGIGYSNIPTNMPATLANSRTAQTTIMPSWYKGFSSTNDTTYVVQNNNMGTFSPVITPQYSGTGYQSAISWIVPDSVGVYSNTLSSGLSGGSLLSFTNWVVFPYDNVWLDTYTGVSGRAMAVRSQYNLAPLQSGYPDAPYSTPLIAPFVKNQKWIWSTMGQTGFDAHAPYQTTYTVQPPPIGGLFIPLQTIGQPRRQMCSASGYYKPFAPQLATGGSQPFISPTIPQAQMSEGLILAQPVPVSRKIFRMPLISAVLGVLIPPDQFKLIPAASLKNLTLQLSLNPYAFFTSGYSDVHQCDVYGMQTINMQKRNWKINRMAWVWHLYTFNSTPITSTINEQLTKGIIISSNYWQLQASYQLANGSYARGTFQIPVNVQSLAQVWCIFLSNQYQTKSFCRKQFRLSNNIYSMQFKANGNYYPLQPIQGNAGNPQMLNTTGDNWDFIEPLYMSYNFLFNTNVPMPRINRKNFAVNGRIYDVNNQQTLIPHQMLSFYPKDTQQALIILGKLGKSINGDTAMGQSWFHENRYIGKAIFSYSFEPYGHSKNLITGLNTVGYRQFDVTFNNSPSNIFPSDQTLLIFTRANVIVRFTENGINVLGA